MVNKWWMVGGGWMVNGWKVGDSDWVDGWVNGRW